MPAPKTPIVPLPEEGVGAHTPLPWAFGFNEVPYAEFADGAWTVDADSGSICTIDCPSADAEANAAFIVRAVNSHDALVEALTDIMAEAELMTMTMRRRKIFQRGADALEIVAKARGEQS